MAKTNIEFKLYSKHPPSTAQTMSNRRIESNLVSDREVSPYRQRKEAAQSAGSGNSVGEGAEEVKDEVNNA